MKKLMITAAAAMLGIAANASTVVWQLSSALADTAFKGGDATAYLVFTTSSTAPAWSDTLNKTYLESHDTYAIADVLSALDSKGTDTTLTATVGTDGKFLSDRDTWSGSAGANKKFYVVVIDDAGENMTIATALKKTAISTQDDKVTLTWSGSTEFSKTWTAVPEPTSGLLLLLGVAGLALRRRRA